MQTWVKVPSHDYTLERWASPAFWPTIARLPLLEDSARCASQIFRIKALYFALGALICLSRTEEDDYSHDSPKLRCDTLIYVMTGLNMCAWLVRTVSAFLFYVSHCLSDNVPSTISISVKIIKYIGYIWYMSYLVSGIFRNVKHIYGLSSKPSTIIYPPHTRDNHPIGECLCP